ncbi:hypothetical protein L596_013521 [Steinernema carpocapsae]|uniref:Uncharacterized protein n=1 Tax=Steinernema carpocapsae TaxID=34508 RepID=A0A4U5P0E9_STECR|nr:hypothetical protein L596_013521 [Steinernema carpocapsae]
MTHLRFQHLYVHALQSQPILRLTIIRSMEVTREEKALVARNLLERTQLQHRQHRDLSRLMSWTRERPLP